jgi:hypothetical protein
VVLGQTFQLEANVTSQAVGNVAYPSGTVTFYDGSTALPGAVQIRDGGTGQIFADLNNVSFSTPGSHSITANYSGDSNYTSATSQPVTINCRIATAITLTASSSSINYGQSVTLTALVTSNAKGPAISNEVAFAGNQTPITIVSTTPGTDANGNQTLTVTGTTTPPGSESINAVFQQDANYGLSSSAFVSITVNIPDFTIGPASGISVIPVAGQAGSGQITITPVSASQAPSTVTLVLSPLAISGYTISLSPQQVNLNGSAVTSTLSLTPVSSANVVHGQVKHAGLLAIQRGKWWGLSLTASLGALFMIGVPGRRKRFRAALGLSVVGLYFFVLGCGGGGGGTSGGGVGSGGGGGGAQATSIALTTTSAKVAQNVQFLITATVTATSGKPLTGTINFSNYGNPLEGGIPLTNDQAQTGSGYINNPGVYQVTATYSGDPSNLSSTSAPLTQVVTGAIPATIQANTGSDAHAIQAMLGVQ